MNRPSRELAAAFGQLTRIPLGRFLPHPATVDQAAAVWAYPVVGLCVGTVSGVVYEVAIRLGMTPLLAAAWGLAANALLTGGLHEDGLADTADGLGGGHTPARRLDIMRDSRIGSYGALALVLALLIRASAIAAIAPARTLVAFAVAGMLGRAAMVLVMRGIAPARPDGQAASLGMIPRGPARAAGAIAIFGVLVLVRLRLAIWLLLATAVVGLLWSRLLRRAIGGYTGDTLGTVEIFVECLALTMMAAR